MSQIEARSIETINVVSRIVCRSTTNSKCKHNFLIFSKTDSLQNDWYQCYFVYKLELTNMFAMVFKQIKKMLYVHYEPYTLMRMYSSLDRLPTVGLTILTLINYMPTPQIAKLTGNYKSQHKNVLCLRHKNPFI